MVWGPAAGGARDAHAWCALTRACVYRCISIMGTQLRACVGRGAGTSCWSWCAWHKVNGILGFATLCSCLSSQACDRRRARAGASRSRDADMLTAPRGCLTQAALQFSAPRPAPGGGRERARQGEAREGSGSAPAAGWAQEVQQRQPLGVRPGGGQEPHRGAADVGRHPG